MNDNLFKALTHVHIRISNTFTPKDCRTTQMHTLHHLYARINLTTIFLMIFMSVNSFSQTRIRTERFQIFKLCGYIQRETLDVTMYAAFSF